MMGVTLRYPYEVRKPDEYFADIENEKIPKDMLDLATHIVDTKRGKFEPAKFEDEYEDALKDLLRKKQKGEKIEQPKERAPSNVINLMDALRSSVKAEGGQSARPAKSAKKGRKRNDGQREMLLPIAGKKGKEAPAKKNRAAARAPQSRVTRLREALTYLRATLLEAQLT
jgi:DNA end-binding protein Ku